jgi:hypothetical protein
LKIFSYFVQAPSVFLLGEKGRFFTFAFESPPET